MALSYSIALIRPSTSHACARARKLVVEGLPQPVKPNLHTYVEEWTREIALVGIVAVNQTVQCEIY